MTHDDQERHLRSDSHGFDAARPSSSSSCACVCRPWWSVVVQRKDLSTAVSLLLTALQYLTETDPWGSLLIAKFVRLTPSLSPRARPEVRQTMARIRLAHID